MPEFAQTHRTTIDADRAVVHGLIDDLHQWRQWSPWEDVDPYLQRSYSGPDAGVGARYEWSGNKKAGRGSMEITHSSPERIDVDLTFIAPMKARNVVVFDLRPTDDGTEVAWTMTGERNLLMHAMGKAYFDQAIGKDFDKGLTRLKAAAEQ